MLLPKSLSSAWMQSVSGGLWYVRIVVIETICSHGLQWKEVPRPAGVFEVRAQQQIVEHLATRQNETEQELAALRAATRPRPAVPDPRMQATQLIPKMSASDDPEIYLEMFERASQPLRMGPAGLGVALARCCVAGRLQPPPGASHAAPKIPIGLNGQKFSALLDSGSTISLVQSRLLPPRMEPRKQLPLTCVHGDTRKVSTRLITVTTAGGSWPLEVGLVRDLPVPIILGGTGGLRGGATHRDTACQPPKPSPEEARRERKPPPCRSPSIGQRKRCLTVTSLPELIPQLPHRGLPHHSEHWKALKTTLRCTHRTHRYTSPDAPLHSRTPRTHRAPSVTDLRPTG
ncbi:uncharacterized protein LOC122341316 [Puntigrus tetrazona]|uniref:uncharacterized protein LOC122341316 n=1 Tax=Puntigrus tetrazona TaxID=1606681 RepID=UPI001C896955|nr:uncharacterized protein LOC122341316 [Puntigrus tetrazona]